MLTRKPIDLQTAAELLRQWTELQRNAIQTGNDAKAAFARRFVVEYTLLVAHLHKSRGQGATVAAQRAVRLQPASSNSPGMSE